MQQVVKDKLTRFDINKETPKIVVLCSGGMDSVTLLAWAKDKYGKSNVQSLFIDIGQTALMEESLAAFEASNGMGIIHNRVSINVRDFMTSSIIGEEVSTKDPAATYVPARNMFFISIATGFAVSNNIQEVGIAVHRDDDGNLYPDTTDGFIREMVGACAWYNISLRAPFIAWTKKDIIRFGMLHKVPYETTISCYWPKKGGIPCRECPSCVLRQRGFDEYHESRSQ